MIRSISVIALAAAFLAATGTPMAAANTAYRQSIAVYFPSGDAALTKQALAVIDETAKLAHEQPGSQIIVIGRTDPSGSDQANARIALERATKTRDALVARNVDPANITVVPRPARETRGLPANFIAERRADMVISPNEATL